MVGVGEDGIDNRMTSGHSRYCLGEGGREVEGGNRKRLTAGTHPPRHIHAPCEPVQVINAKHACYAYAVRRRDGIVSDFLFLSLSLQLGQGAVEFWKDHAMV